MEVMEAQEPNTLGLGVKDRSHQKQVMNPAYWVGQDNLLQN